MIPPKLRSYKCIGRILEENNLHETLYCYSAYHMGKIIALFIAYYSSKQRRVFLPWLALAGTTENLCLLHPLEKPTTRTRKILDRDERNSMIEWLWSLYYSHCYQIKQSMNCPLMTMIIVIMMARQYSVSRGSKGCASYIYCRVFTCLQVLSQGTDCCTCTCNESQYCTCNSLRLMILNVITCTCTQCDTVHVIQLLPGWTLLENKKYKYDRSCFER